MKKSLISSRKVMLETRERYASKRRWWLSFCDPSKPKGKKFIGVAIVEAHSIIHAMELAHDLGINPGGEIFSYVVDDIPDGILNRLLYRKDLEAAGLVLMRIG